MTYTNVNNKLNRTEKLFIPGVCSQPAFYQLWACAWFTEIVKVKAISTFTWLDFALRWFLFGGMKYG